MSCATKAWAIDLHGGSCQSKHLGGRPKDKLDPDSKFQAKWTTEWDAVSNKTNRQNPNQIATSNKNKARHPHQRNKNKKPANKQQQKCACEKFEEKTKISYFLYFWREIALILPGQGYSDLIVWLVNSSTKFYMPEEKIPVVSWVRIVPWFIFINSKCFSGNHSLKGKQYWTVDETFSFTNSMCCKPILQYTLCVLELYPLTISTICQDENNK